MNKIRRQKISDLKGRLEKLTDNLKIILDEEQDYYDNIPENLLGSERAETSEESIEQLTDAIDQLEDVMELLEEAVA